MDIARNARGAVGAGVEVTRLGLGTTGIANLYRAVSEQDAAATVDAAWECGVRYFDTAPAYGFGLAEQRLGSALRGRPREQYVVSTKVGYALEPLAPGESGVPLWDGGPALRSRFDFSRDAVRRSLEDTLQRLGLDRVDMVAIHDPDEAASIEPGRDPYAASHFEQAMRETYPVLDELRSQGVIRAVGVGMNGTEMLADFAEVGDFDYFLVAGRYTLLEQQPALGGLLELCERKGIAVIVGGPYSSGILATGAVAGATYNYGPAPPDVLQRVRAIEAVCARHGVELAAAALQFPLAHPSVVSVIPGARSPQELRENARLLAAPIGDAFWAELSAAELVDAAAPTPVAPAA